MPNQEYPTVDELCKQLLTDKHLYENAERLLQLCSELKIVSKRAARNSYYFLYKSKYVFKFYLSSTLSYKGFDKVDHSNSLHVSLSVGNIKKENPEQFLSSLPNDLRTEYLSSPTTHCRRCSRSYTSCPYHFLEYEENTRKYPLCTNSYGYRRFNPNVEQFSMIERFIKLRVKNIDEQSIKQRTK